MGTLHACGRVLAVAPQRPTVAVRAVDGGAQTTRRTPLICRRCKGEFYVEGNRAGACTYHPQLWAGGEVAKAIGFVRESAAPEHQLRAVVGKSGLMRFWDCCGAESEAAPGCCTGPHVAFGEEL